MAAIDLYVGGDVISAPLTGLRCFSAAYPLLTRYTPEQVSELDILLDSGAFTDRSVRKRLTFAGALDRQLAWLARVARRIGVGVESLGVRVCSYDYLIPDVWGPGAQPGSSWTLAEAEWAVDVTVEAAAYLASQRERLAPWTLVLGAQGIDAIQYEECVERVLAYAQPGDWLALGGWCHLGRYTRALPTFDGVLRRVLPRVVEAGLTRVHIFGVLYRPGLGHLLHLADQYGLTVSTDSAAPLLAFHRYRRARSGAQADTPAENVAWWQQTLVDLRSSKYYVAPPDVPYARQVTWDEAAVVGRLMVWETPAVDWTTGDLAAAARERGKPVSREWVRQLCATGQIACGTQRVHRRIPDAEARRWLAMWCA